MGAAASGVASALSWAEAPPLETTGMIAERRPVRIEQHRPLARLHRRLLPCMSSLPPRSTARSTLAAASAT